MAAERGMESKERRLASRQGADDKRLHMHEAQTFEPQVGKLCSVSK